MATVDQTRRRNTAAGASWLRPALIALGIGQVALGAVLAIAPGEFFDAIADYGTRNDHFLRDISTFYLALGVALIAAADRPSWRVPVLVLATIQYGLHAINHLIDIDEADPGWIGPFNFVTLALTAVLLVGVLRESSRARS